MSRRRAPTLLLLACALFLRLWVPAGWMPSADRGAFAIEPCAAAAAPMPMAHHDHGSSGHKNAHDGDCAFAPHHAGLAQLALPAPLPQPRPAPAPLPLRLESRLFATGPPALPPPSTGPPALT